MFVIYFLPPLPLPLPRRVLLAWTLATALWSFSVFALPRLLGSGDLAGLSLLWWMVWGWPTAILLGLRCLSVNRPPEPPAKSFAVRLWAAMLDGSLWDAWTTLTFPCASGPLIATTGWGTREPDPVCGGVKSAGLAIWTSPGFTGTGIAETTEATSESKPR